MMSYLNIGRFIRDKREYKHWTVAELAELCQMSVTALENIELGDSDPKWSTVKRIFNSLSVDVGELNACVYGKDLSYV